MGTYATTTSLQTLLVNITFDSATTSLATTLIGHAEAEVNKHLSKRYDLSASQFQTSTSIPPLVRSLTEKLSEAYMWQRNSRGSKESLKRGEMLEKSALDNLMLIRDYKADLVNTLGAVIADGANAGMQIKCNTTDYTPTFAEDEETSWAVDSDKLEDISNARD